MNVEDPRHGTTAGHLAHRRDGEPACPPCVAAKTRYEKIRHVYGDRMVPALGTRRRVQALMAMGHSGADIAAQLGVTYQAVHKIKAGTADKVFASTAANVARAYESMCMTLPTGPHRTRIRNAALRAGYAPPLAWDDIDTDPEPTDWRYEHADRAGAIRELADLGLGITEAARRLHLSRDAVEKWCQRRGMADVYRRLAAREAVWQNQHTREAS